MALTDLAVRQAAPRDKKYRLSDSERLELEIYPNGIKRWCFRYSFGARRCELPIGKYPAVSLADARKARDRHNVALTEGVDPAAAKRALKREQVRTRENTFGNVLKAWVETYNPDEGRRAEQLKGFAEKGMSEKKVEARHKGWLRTYGKLIGQVKHLDSLSKLPFAEVTPRELLDAIRKVEAAGKSVTAHELRSSLNALYRYAVLEAIITKKESLEGALQDGLLPKEEGGRAAIIDQAELGRLLRDVEGYNHGILAKAAMTLGLLTFVRPGELQCMEWEEVDWQGERWIIPEHRMKRDIEHWVPLSRQALAELERLRHAHKMMRRQSPFVFPHRSNDNKTMSGNTVNTALRSMGWPGEAICGHGFRASAATTLQDVLKFDERWIDLQLSHAQKNKTKAAYLRGAFWPDRKRMMQEWADWLDHLRAGAPVVQLGAPAPVSAA